jgi:hypothetical protein
MSWKHPLRTRLRSDRGVDASRMANAPPTDVVLEFQKSERTEIDVGTRPIARSLGVGSNRTIISWSSHDRQYLGMCARYTVYTRQRVDVRHMR